MARHLRNLETIEKSLGKLGLKHFLIKAAKEIPLHTLYCELPSEGSAEPWKVFFSFMPYSDHDEGLIKLFQAYVEFADAKTTKMLAQKPIGNLLNTLNNNVLFGKFALLDGKIVYRYILSLPHDFSMEEGYLKQWLEMIYYNLESTRGQLKEFAPPVEN